MCNSLPVISTYEGGIKDIVETGRTGYLVEQRNVIDLANKLETLINNSNLRIQMGDAGRQKYEQEFTLEKFENRLNDILHRVIVK